MFCSKLNEILTVKENVTTCRNDSFKPLTVNSTQILGLLQHTCPTSSFLSYLETYCPFKKYALLLLLLLCSNTCLSSSIKHLSPLLFLQVCFSLYNYILSRVSIYAHAHFYEDVECLPLLNIFTFYKSDKRKILFAIS